MEDIKVRLQVETVKAVEEGGSSWESLIDDILAEETEYIIMLDI